MLLPYLHLRIASVPAPTLFLPLQKEVKPEFSLLQNAKNQLP
jgi:hypothetical protein